MHEQNATKYQISTLPGSLIVGSLEQIFQKEGLRGMYRGLGPTVLALLPNWAVRDILYRIYFLFMLLGMLIFHKRRRKRRKTANHASY